MPDRELRAISRLACQFAFSVGANALSFSVMLARLAPNGDGVPPITAMVADDSYCCATAQVGAWAMNPQLILAVAIGRALGSVARYLVGIGSGKLFGSNFPFGTLVINVTGSALIGVFVGLFATKWDLPPFVRIFLIVGICGGYTTFSTFSLDAWFPIERGQSMASIACMGLSVVLSLAALVGGTQRFILGQRVRPTNFTTGFRGPHRTSAVSTALLSGKCRHQCTTTVSYGRTSRSGPIGRVRQ